MLLGCVVEENVLGFVFFLQHSVLLCVFFVSRFLTTLCNCTCCDCSPLCNVISLLLPGLKLFCVGYSSEHQSCQMLRRVLWVNWRTFNSSSVHMVQKSRWYKYVTLSLSLSERLCFVRSWTDLILLFVLFLLLFFLLLFFKNSLRLRRFKQMENGKSRTTG